MRMFLAARVAPGRLVRFRHILTLLAHWSSGLMTLPCHGRSGSSTLPWAAIYSGVVKIASRLPHKQEIAGANPVPATNFGLVV